MRLRNICRSHAEDSPQCPPALRLHKNHRECTPPHPRAMPSPTGETQQIQWNEWRTFQRHFSREHAEETQKSYIRFRSWRDDHKSLIRIPAEENVCSYLSFKTFISLFYYSIQHILLSKILWASRKIKGNAIRRGRAIISITIFLFETVRGYFKYLGLIGWRLR